MDVTHPAKLYGSKATLTSLQKVFHIKPQS